MRPKPKPDPILSEVVANVMLSVAEEIGYTLIRTAHSPNIRERWDCSTAIMDVGGRIVAQAPFIPMHLGSMVGLIGEVLKRFPTETLQPGEIFIANDPYSGGGAHLPDITVVTPVFHRGRPVAFAANIAHHADVGGMVPGSESAACTTIYQEGIRLPPVRIRPELGRNDPVTQLIMSSSRTPAERLGDLEAQLAALNVGVKGVEEVYDRYGASTVSACMDDYIEYSDRRMRHAIGRLRPGSYSFSDHLDTSEGGSDSNLIRVAVKVDGDSIDLDFSGTSPQMPNGKNIPTVATLSVVYCVAKMLLDPEIPANSGTYRKLAVRAPEGCLLNPVSPAAVGARAISCGILGDVVVGALAQAMPERALAPSGPHALTTFAGTDPDTGQPFVDYETTAGALGARPYTDGTDAVRIHASGAANLPIESLELSYPMQAVRYELMRDGGGAGTLRGGMPVRRDTRVLTEDVTISTTGDRHGHPAPGLEGGLPGVPGEFVLNPDLQSQERIPSVSAGLPLRPGDIVSVRTPGGGGYGDPLLRDPERVLEDLLDDRISKASAREEYGVVVRDGRLDLKATERLRGRLRRD